MATKLKIIETILHPISNKENARERACVIVVEKNNPNHVKAIISKSHWEEMKMTGPGGQGKKAGADYPGSKAEGA